MCRLVNTRWGMLMLCVTRTSGMRPVLSVVFNSIENYDCAPLCVDRTRLTLKPLSPSNAHIHRLLYYFRRQNVQRHHSFGRPELE